MSFLKEGSEWPISRLAVISSPPVREDLAFGVTKTHVWPPSPHLTSCVLRQVILCLSILERRIILILIILITISQLILSQWDHVYKILDPEPCIFKADDDYLVILLLCVCVLVTQSCLTLRDPMDCSPTSSSVHGILQARILEWVAISFARGSSRSRDWTHVSCIAGRFFMVGATPLQIWAKDGGKKALHSLPVAQFLDYGAPESSRVVFSF